MKSRTKKKLDSTSKKIKLRSTKRKDRKLGITYYIQKGGGGGLLKKCFPFCFPSGKKVEKTTPSELQTEILQKFKDKFDARIGYFPDTMEYHPTIDENKNELEDFFKSSSTLQTMIDINDKITSKKTRTPKIVHTILLHGTMKEEAMRHLIPPNVILCNISTPKRANIIMSEYNFSVHKFFFNAKSDIVNKIFLERTLHSIPDNFNVIHNKYKMDNNVPNLMENAIECFKKANWFYPGQLYYDINLKSGGKANKIFHSRFYKDKPVNEETKYPSSFRTSLSEQLEKFSKDDPGSIILVINTSCQPYYIGDTPAVKKRNLSILGYIFKYNAITYDLNLSIDEAILKQKQPSMSLEINKGRKHLYVPFCRTINERFISLLIEKYKSDFYFTNPIVKRSYNISREYPFFQYIENQMRKRKLPMREIKKYCDFIDDISFQKKLAFYYKLTNEFAHLTNHANKNFTRLVQTFRERSYFIVDTFMIFETLYEKYKKKFTEYQDYREDILDSDMGAIIEVLQVMFFSVKYKNKKADMSLVNKYLQTFFLGHNLKEMGFFYQKIFLHPLPYKFKKLKLLKVATDQGEFSTMIKKYIKVTEYDFQRLKSEAEITFAPTKKNLARLTAINCPTINIKLLNTPGYYRKLVHLELDNVKTNSNLVLQNLNLKSLVLRNLPTTRIISLEKLKLQVLKANFIKETHFSCEKVKVVDFSVTLDDIEPEQFTMVQNNLEVKSVRIDDENTLLLYLGPEPKIKTSKPISDITFTSELSDRYFDNVISGINTKGILSFGKTTTFTINLYWNTILIQKIKRECKGKLKKVEGVTM